MGVIKIHHRHFVLYKPFGYLSQFYSNSKQQKSKKFLAWLKLYDDWSLKFLAYLVDIYTFARMMRHFEDNTSPKYIIVYMGVKHIEHIMEFLDVLNIPRIHQEIQNTELAQFFAAKTQIEKKSVKTAEEKSLLLALNKYEFQCLDTSGFKLPFFSK